MANNGKYNIGIRLLLLKEYLQANAGKDRAVSRRELEEHLAEHDVKGGMKAIYADFAVLESEFGLHLEYDQSKKGWKLLNPPFEPYELRLLVDGIQSSKFITKSKADEITEKIKSLAGKETKATLNRQTYVADRVRSMNDSVVKDADKIHKAIRDDRKIAFRYFHYSPDRKNSKTYSKNGAKYIVSPFALIWNNGNYYLYAYDGAKFRYFRVDRMEQISEPLSDKREGKDLFKERDITTQKAKVFDMFGGDIYNVNIRFRNELADAVIDQFGKGVIMRPCDEEHFTVVVPVETSPPFFAWIATFGRRVKILEPEAVVEKMRDFLTKSMDMYKNDGEK